MSEDWGNDPIQTAAGHDDWGNDPIVKKQSRVAKFGTQAKAQEPKKAGLYEEFSTGVAEPLVGAAQIGARLANDIDEGRDENLVRATDKAASDLQKGLAVGRANAGRTGFDYGELAGNIASPINMIPLGAVSKGETGAKMAGPVLGRIVRGVANSAKTTGLGGAVIAALNPVSGGDFWSEKTKQAAVGLISGTVVPPVLSASSKALVKAGSAAVAPIVHWVSGVKGPNAVLSAAQQEIMRRLAQGAEGGGPSAQDMLDLAAKTPGKPLTLMDVRSQPVTALAGRTARTPGAAGQTMRDFLGDRTANQGVRLEGDVSQNISGRNAAKTVEAMQQARAHAAAPLYEKAYAANQNMQSPAIDRILETPAGKAALNAARLKMQNDMTLMGRPDPELAEQIGESGQKLPFRGGAASGLKLRTLDYVKRSMDDMIGAARRSGENDNARILTGLKSSLVNEMDNADVTAKAGPNSLKPQGGLYKQARGSYSGHSQSMDAVEFGQNALKPSVGTEELAAGFQKLNPSDKEFARIGLAQSLRDRIGGKDVGTNAARQLARNPALQRRVRVFFSDDASYQKFMDSVSAEDTMFRTHTATLGGSQTAERLSEDSNAETIALGHAAKAGLELHSGNVLGAGRSILRAVTEYARRPNPELGAQISKLLTTPFNEQGSHSLKLLRDFSAVSPGTRNYLMQATNRAHRLTMIPAGVAGGQTTNP